MIYVIPYLGILIASMVALGFMASIHNSAKNNFGGGKCLLYSTVHDKHVEFNTGQSCKFIIYGEAALGILAVLLIILSVVKAVFGKWLFPILVFDYFALILGVIFSMSVGITLSLGIIVICKSFSDAHDDDVSCSQYSILPASNPDKAFFFYKGLHKAEQVAWIVFGLYSLMLIVQCAMTCISFGVKYMRKKKFKIPYENFGNSYTAPI